MLAAGFSSVKPSGWFFFFFFSVCERRVGEIPDVSWKRLRGNSLVSESPEKSAYMFRSFSQPEHQSATR